MEIIDNSNKKVFDLFISEEEIEEICILSGYCSYSAFYDIANNDKAKKIPIIVIKTLPIIIIF